MDESLLALIANGMNSGVVSGSGANATSLASLLGAGDLNTFAQQAQANDILGQIAPVVASFRPDRTNWDLGTSFGTSLGQAFLAGALGNQSRANVADQVKKVSTVLPSLYSDPIKTVAPEGIDATAWEGLKTAATVKNLQRQIGEQTKDRDLVRKLMEDVYGADISAIKTGKETKAKINSENEAYGFKPGDAAGTDGKNLNPNSPQYKIDQDLQARADKIESEANSTLKSAPIVQNYQVRLSSLQNVLGNLNNNTTYGDLALVNGFQKIMDPEGSVREGDVTTVQGAQDRLSKYWGDTKGWWTSDGKLKPEYRKQLAQTAINTTNSFGKIYKDYTDQVITGVVNKGGKKENLAYVPHTEFNLDNYLGGSGGDDIKAQAAAILAQRNGIVPAIAGPGPK